ncbi:ABC transporter ATP-binding protein [Planosporangium mesophilum]|uniref:Aliphatic sulfonates import ATP-binding protein SsuB n=1 Tax=Planosporangium mesophilum TaxID=689768 RepID=A0A8J3X3D9_9ACTN|nr:ABC transporter ATP-binding protein [Planosporangium mesophilum]NJC83883.1 ABC transporter ATP-binding protein [Planosporangium mesophilum]GII22758.1 aliphatic sulfonates import ATP-binding protein SsuB [Planosporangium mesophilum]
MATRTESDVTDLDAATGRGAAVVVATGLRRTFGAATVLNGVDLVVGRGEVVALLGSSGSGKSTLLRILAGLDAEADGEVTTNGRVAVVFQEHRLMPWKRVADNVALGLRGADVPERTAAALAEVGLAERTRAWPAELSGGQSQRVAVARALVRQPDLLLLDEPFGALDALTRLKMQALLQRLRLEHGFAALLVTHDVDEALLLADRILILDNGVIAQDVPVTLAHPRAHDRPGFSELRRHLLARLGVPADPDG